MRLLLAGLIVGLAGCGAMPDDKICTVPPPLDLAELAGPNAKPAIIQAEECVHRWSYRLAKSPDDARVVAEAVVALCEKPIGDQIISLINQSAPLTPDGETQPMGRPRAVEFANRQVPERSRKMALGYVVQARAGHCKVPA